MFLRDQKGARLRPVSDFYRFGRVLAEGGISLIVSLTPVTPYGAPAVLKILQECAQEEYRGHILREGRFLCRCSSSRVVRFLGWAMTEEYIPALLLEQIGDGETLESYALCRASHALPLKEVCRLFDMCLKGVAHLHEQDIAHRDLKPSNFCLASRGEVKLIDLSLASAFYERGLRRWGTSEYHSPEAVPFSSIDPEGDDLFALALILAEMLRGEFIGDGADLAHFAGDVSPCDISRKRRKKLNELHAEAAGFGEELAEFIRKGTSLEPENRFRSIGEMITAFEWLR